MTAPFRLAALDPAHDRSNFDCGVPALDRYLQQQVGQDQRRRLASCFVALDGANRIAGYYTLASAGIALTELPAELASRLPRYPSVPAVRMGRLAVDRAFKRQGLGAALLVDAIERTLRAEIAAHALLVDAKNADAAAFYRHHGFIELAGLRLFLPLASVSISAAARPR